MKNKGELTVGVSAVLATATLIASTLVAYYTAQISTESRITRVETLQGEQDSINDDVNARMIRFENKLDTLLIHFSIDPNASITRQSLIKTNGTK